MSMPSTCNPTHPSPLQDTTSQKIVTVSLWKNTVCPGSALECVSGNVSVAPGPPSTANKDIIVPNSLFIALFVLIWAWAGGDKSPSLRIHRGYGSAVTANDTKQLPDGFPCVPRQYIPGRSLHQAYRCLHWLKSGQELIAKQTYARLSAAQQERNRSHNSIRTNFHKGLGSVWRR